LSISSLEGAEIPLFVNPAVKSMIHFVAVAWFMDRRNFLKFVVAFIAARFFTVNSSMAQTIPKHSMKGFELYSWQEHNSWRFALLVGTNRNKQPEEIKAPAVVLQNLEELKHKLAALDKGEYVTWLSTSRIPGLSLAPVAMVQEVRRYCKTLGLVFQV
jgi:hypothetical protein